MMEEQMEEFRTVVNGYRLHGELGQNQEGQLVFSLCIQPNHDKSVNYTLNFTDKNLYWFGLDEAFASVKLFYEHLSKMTKTKLKFDSRNDTLFILYRNKKISKQFPIDLSSIPNFQQTKMAQKQEQTKNDLLKEDKTQSIEHQDKQIFIHTQCEVQHQILQQKQASETIAESISRESLTQHESHAQPQQLDGQIRQMVQNQEDKKDEVTQKEVNIDSAEKLQQQLRTFLGCAQVQATKQQVNCSLPINYTYSFAKKQHQHLNLYEFGIQFKLQKLVESIQNGQLDKLPEIILKRARLVEIPPFNQVLLGNLIQLSLQENNIGKIENLDSIPNLEKLNLEANNIKTIENLGSLKSLRFLKLGNNKIQRISGLQNLISLQVLWLDFNSIENIQGLTTLSSLKSLNLSFNSITRLQGLDGLSSLQELLLNENQLTQIQNLAPLSKLTRLSLNSNFITQIRGLRRLLLLEVIYLAGNAIGVFDRMAFDEINWLKMLKQLRLNGNQIDWNEESLKLVERLKNYGVKVKV